MSLLTIFVYSFAGAICLPLPSEAPMFLLPELPRLLVLLACGSGKAAGCYLVFVCGERLYQLPVVGPMLRRSWQTSSGKAFARWSASILHSYGPWGYLALMALPGIPTRTATYCASVLPINKVVFTSAAAIGTIVRNALVYSVYVYWLRSTP